MNLFFDTKPLIANVSGVDHPVKLRRNVQAKKMILRVDGISGEIKLTAPLHVSQRKLQRFVDENNAWLLTERAKVGARPPVQDGSMLSFAGQSYRVCYSDTPPRGVKLIDREIHVGGPADQAPARLMRWLKAQAKERLGEDAAYYADLLGVSYKRVSIGDMKSRWGSCSSSGTLRFNWRLVLAEPSVRRYVAAHEVAHILEMNHSDRFWHHVEQCVPNYKSERKWLKTRGHSLMQLRFTSLQIDG